MLSNIANKISPCIKLILMLMMITMILLAKSLYFVLFLTCLIIIEVIIFERKVKLYVKVLKKLILFLLILLIIYILIMEQSNYLFIILFLYKMLLIIILVTNFVLFTRFDDIHQNLYYLFRPLKILGIDVNHISFQISLSISFLRFLLTSKEEIEKINLVGTRQKNKLLVVESIVYSTNKLEKLEENLKIKQYKLNYSKTNLFSKIILILYVLLLILCVFKEVIV